MQFQKHWLSLVSTACCVCLMLTVFSSTAFAAEAGNSFTFAEVYGLEIADGENRRIVFENDSFGLGVRVTNVTTIDEVAVQLNGTLQRSDCVFSCDVASGQLIAIDDEGNRVNFTISADGIELTPKPSTPSTTPSSISTMTDLLAAISSVLSAAVSWISAVSDSIVANPILLLCVVMGFLGTGILLFRRLLNL